MRLKGFGAALGAALVGAAIVGLPAVLADAPGPVLPACPSDDGGTAVVCYWDATRQGNGKGESFIALPSGDTASYSPQAVPDGVPGQCASELGSTRVGQAYCAWKYPDGTELTFNTAGDVVAVKH